MFIKEETSIPGCYLIKPRVFTDNRGDFIKIFNKDTFEKIGIQSEFEEVYYSISSKGVIRGLHFQEPPHAHVKHILCLSGQLFDVVVDLRPDSPTYGKHFSVTLSSDIPTILSIPEGLAHGFMALTDDCVFLNKTSTVYSPESDCGIRWDSCGIQWPNLDPVVSEKDKQLTKFSEYSSPF